MFKNYILEITTKTVKTPNLAQVNRGYLKKLTGR